MQGWVIYCWPVLFLAWIISTFYAKLFHAMLCHLISCSTIWNYLINFVKQVATPWCLSCLVNTQFNTIEQRIQWSLKKQKLLLLFMMLLDTSSKEHQHVQRKCWTWKCVSSREERRAYTLEPHLTINNSLPSKRYSKMYEAEAWYDNLTGFLHFTFFFISLFYSTCWCFHAVLHYIIMRCLVE